MALGGRGDNLTIGIGVDTQKLRADVALVKVELENINKAVKAAARAGDISALTASTASQDQAIRQLQRYNQVLRESTRTHTQAAPAIAALTSRFEGLGTAAVRVANQFVDTRSIFTLTLGAIGAGFIKLSLDAAKATDELSDSAQAIGISIQKLQAVQLAGALQGADPEVITQGLERFARSLGTVQIEQDKLNGELGNSFRVLRGNLSQAAGEVDIARGSLNRIGVDGKRAADSLEAIGGSFDKPVSLLRGGMRPILDTSNAFKTLGIRLEDFPRTAEGTLAAYRAVAVAIERLGDSAEKAALASQIFGRGWSRQIEVLIDFDKNIKEAESLINRFGIAVTDVEKKQSDAFLKSFFTLRTVISRTSTIIFNIIGEALTPLFDALTKLIGGNSQAIRDWAITVGSNLRQIGLDFIALISGVSDKEIKTQWLLDLRNVLVSVRDIIAAAAPIIVGAISTIRSALAPIEGDDQPGIFKRTADEIQGISNGINTVTQALTDFDAFIKSFDDPWLKIIADLKASFADLFATIAAGFNSAKSAIGSLLGGTSQAPQQQGFAGGGPIRGAGTGTSDSVPFWGSNGEFVMRTAAVRRWGIGFMHAINNGFAMGGLVGAPPIGFAAGGLVSDASSSGRPVHLHLGGQSFALSGTTAVVDALVSHAHSQQIRSTGVKPSWFAARPSGR